jgi:hypothetical protein
MDEIGAKYENAFEATTSNRHVHKNQPQFQHQRTRSLDDVAALL